MADLQDSEMQVCLPKNMFLIMNKLSEDDQRIIEAYIDKTEKMYKTELADLKKKVEELEKKRDFLLVEKNQLQKDKDRLLEEHMKAFRKNMEEYQKMTSRILTSQDARDVLKNITFIQIGSQTNTEITWKNNQITDSEINANSNVFKENSSESTPQNDYRENNESDMRNQRKSALDAINDLASGFNISYTRTILRNRITKQTILRRQFVVRIWRRQFYFFLPEVRDPNMFALNMKRTKLMNSFDLLK